MNIKKYGNQKQKNRGLSLTETLLVLGVISAVAVIAYKGYESALALVKAAGEAQGIATTINGVQRTFSQAIDYSNLTTAIVIEAGLEPLYFRKTGSGASATLRGMYGTQITIGPQTAPIANDRRFQLVDDNIPSAGCTQLAMASTNFGTEVYISKAGVPASSSDAIKNATTINPDVILVVSKCSGPEAKRITIVN